MRWEPVGELEDGRLVDPLPPEADFGDGFPNSLWMQLPYRLERYEPLGAWICRRYRAASGASLRRWRITKIIRAPYGPGVAIPEETRRLVLERDCAGDG
jgi:hypothetical protein